MEYHHESESYRAFARKKSTLLGALRYILAVFSGLKSPQDFEGRQLRMTSELRHRRAAETYGGCRGAKKSLLRSLATKEVICVPPDLISALEGISGSMQCVHSGLHSILERNRSWAHISGCFPLSCRLVMRIFAALVIHIQPLG